MKKKIFLGMMTTCLLLSLAACGTNEAANGSGEAQTEAATEATTEAEAAEGITEEKADEVAEEVVEEAVLKQLPKEATEEGAKYYKLAMDALQHNDYDNTLKYAQQAIEAGDGRGGAIAANVCAARGKYADALDYLLTGYEMDGLNAEYIAIIGDYYLNGYGTEKNVEEAKKYYEEAVLYGYTDAEAVLADIENGVYND